jgi:negative modulator of initiation of replication
VFSELERASYLTKMPVPQIVRGLVIRSERKASPSTFATYSARTATELSARDRKLCDYVQSPTFLAGRNVVDLFLSVLSFLHSENHDKFGLLESMEGRNRRYIARNEGELETSGKSVNPKRIPSTGYWVVTNNSTDNKKLLLRRVLTLLGYSAETIRSVPESLR